MKIWNLPPRYLDDYHLAQDFESTKLLFYSQDDQFPPEYELYLFLKLKLLENELERRYLLDFTSGIVPCVDIPNASNIEFPSLRVIRLDVNALLTLWETMLNGPHITDELADKVESLSIATYEEIHDELIFSLEHIREKYISSS